MSNYNAYTTTAGSSYGITLSPESADQRPRTPAGLIVTQAVQTKDGWLGQVIVDKQIVWESAVDDDGEAAVKAANTHAVNAIKHLFRLTADADQEAS